MASVKIAIVVGLVLVILLVIFRDTPLVHAMEAFVMALGRLFLAIFTLFARLITAV